MSVTHIKINQIFSKYPNTTQNVKNMTGKTLIVYSTKTGINAEAAYAMAEILKTKFSTDVTVEDLKDGQPDITPFQDIIVGGGVRGTNVYNEAVDFLEKDFGGRGVALYFCCEDNENPKAENTEENARKALAKNKSLKPIDVAAFGGCVIKQGRPVLDDLNMNRLQAWTMELGKKFGAQSQPQLNMVPPGYEFKFYTDPENNTGITASSTVEFAEKLQAVPMSSITFHFQRQDFQRWFRNTIGDEEIAKRIDHINIWLYDESLKKELWQTIQNRLDELTKP